MGDIAGSAYEGRSHRTKDYNRVKMFSSRARFTDDTVCTFACAEAFIDGLDMGRNLWKCCNEHPHAGYGHKYKIWLASHNPQPYYSFGNGSAMRCSPAGWLASPAEECIDLATATAAPTHNRYTDEGRDRMGATFVSVAVATALAIFYLRNGHDKQFIEDEVLRKYYPQWAGRKYNDFHDEYVFNSTRPGSVGPAIICFLESEDYVDCIKLAISLGGDADTLAAIAGPMAYAYYREMPEELVYQAMKTLPDWMVDVNERFDKECDKRNN